MLIGQTADKIEECAQEGYRGTSYESVFLLSASEAGLRKVNEMYSDFPPTRLLLFNIMYNRY